MTYQYEMNEAQLRAAVKAVAPAIDPRVFVDDMRDQYTVELSTKLTLRKVISFEEMATARFPSDVLAVTLERGVKELRTEAIRGLGLDAEMQEQIETAKAEAARGRLDLLARMKGDLGWKISDSDDRRAVQAYLETLEQAERQEGHDAEMEARKARERKL